MDKVKWIVPDLIPYGLTVLAFYHPRMEEPFFAWNIALAVARGDVALSSIEVETPRNVTYLALNESLPSLNERLDLLMGEDRPDNMHIVVDMRCTRLDRRGLEALQEHIFNTRSEFLIVEPWVYVQPELDGAYTSDSAQKRLIPIRSFTDRMEIATMLVTYTARSKYRKNVFDEIRDAKAMGSVCDTMLLLERSKDSYSLHVKRLQMQQETFPLSIHNGIWKLEGCGQK